MKVRVEWADDDAAEETFDDATAEYLPGVPVVRIKNLSEEIIVDIPLAALRRIMVE
jgi:hypothetical protein